MGILTKYKKKVLRKQVGHKLENGLFVLYLPKTFAFSRSVCREIFYYILFLCTYSQYKKKRNFLKDIFRVEIIDFINDSISVAMPF